MVVLGKPAALADDQTTDVAVQLKGAGFPDGAFGRFDVSITNNGRDPLQSATVKVRADRPVLTAQTPCSFHRPTATLTCQFGTLAVGATATASSVLWFSLGSQFDRFDLTATRVASVPADPNPTNDTAIETCEWWGSGIPPLGGPLKC
jgi:hypothetical protein